MSEAVNEITEDEAIDFKFNIYTSWEGLDKLSPIVNESVHLAEQENDILEKIKDNDKTLGKEKFKDIRNKIIDSFQTLLHPLETYKKAEVGVINAIGKFYAKLKDKELKAIKIQSKADLNFANFQNRLLKKEKAKELKNKKDVAIKSHLVVMDKLLEPP